MVIIQTPRTYLDILDINLGTGPDTGYYGICLIRQFFWITQWIFLYVLKIVGYTTFGHTNDTFVNSQGCHITREALYFFRLTRRGNYSPMRQMIATIRAWRMVDKTKTLFLSHCAVWQKRSMNDLFTWDMCVAKNYKREHSTSHNLLIS